MVGFHHCTQLCASQYLRVLVCSLMIIDVLRVCHIVLIFYERQLFVSDADMV